MREPIGDRRAGQRISAASSDQAARHSFRSALASSQELTGISDTTLCLSAAVLGDTWLSSHLRIRSSWCATSGEILRDVADTQAR
jgi:hypothetical protein